MKMLRDLYDAEIARMNQPHYWLDGKLQYLGDATRNCQHAVSTERQARIDAWKATGRSWGIDLDIDWSKAYDLAVAEATVAVPTTGPTVITGVDMGAGKPVWGLSSYDAFRNTKVARQPIKSDLRIGVLSIWEVPEGRQDSAKETLVLSCQCGSGSNLIGLGHSDWCQCHSASNC